MRRSVLGLVPLLFASTSSAAYCPSYTPSTSSCGVSPVAGTNPTISTWNTIFDSVSKGPAGWGSDGPSVGTMKKGCTTVVTASPEYPCVVMKAVMMQESLWQHFCVPTLPSSQVGAGSRTIVSSDCGYGIAQITSGMRSGETASFSRTRVAGEPKYNLQVGARFFSEKWAVVNCVGDRQPSVAEHWYSAMWAYNGLSYINNPNNPNKRAGRGVYRPASDGGSQSSWTYSERIFGHVENPADSRYWSSVALAYPVRSDVGTTSQPRAMPEPRCASPTSCASTRPTHSATCTGAIIVQDAGAPLDGGTANTDSGVAPNDSGVVVKDAGPSTADADDSVDVPFIPEEERPKDEPMNGDGEPYGSCLCRATGTPSNGWWAVAGAALVLLARRRRRA